MFKRKQDEYDNNVMKDKVEFFNEIISDQMTQIKHLEANKEDLKNKLYNSEEIIAIKKQSSKIVEDM